MLLVLDHLIMINGVHNNILCEGEGTKYEGTKYEGTKVPSSNLLLLKNLLYERKIVYTYLKWFYFLSFSFL